MLPIRLLALCGRLYSPVPTCLLPPRGMCTRPVSCQCCCMVASARSHVRKHLKQLNAFHHRCIRTVLGITNQRQWEERITSGWTREQWGDKETITVKLMKRRLEWLGHLARMPGHHIPKVTLFSWLPKQAHVEDQEEGGETS